MHDQVDSAMKQEEIMPFAVTYGPREHHSKVNKSEREKQTACGVTYRWNVGMDANELAYESRRDVQT